MTELKPMRFNLPTLKKLAKRGSNIKLLEWLTAYSEFFYAKGYQDGKQSVVQRDTDQSKVPSE